MEIYYSLKKHGVVSMRNIDQTDFETSNIEFIEFWVQDPFIKKPFSTGGQFILTLEIFPKMY